MSKIKTMMKTKLISRDGESIAETLVSLLILTLAVMMLAGSVVSAAKVNRKTKDMNVEFITVDKSGASNLNDSSSTAVITHGGSATTSVSVLISTTKDDNKYTFYQSQ